jgi:hypothetical protein
MPATGGFLKKGDHAPSGKIKNIDYYFLKIFENKTINDEAIILARPGFRSGCRLSGVDRMH